MNITDPIADFLTRIRNAQMADHAVVTIPASKMKITLAYILKDHGFIDDFRCFRDKKQGLIKIALRYTKDGKGVIQSLERHSKPGRRVYKSSSEIPYVRNGFGIGIFSTSMGVMTCKQARVLGVGGEYLCSVF